MAEQERKPDPTRPATTPPVPENAPPTPERSDEPVGPDAERRGERREGIVSNPDFT